MNNILYHWSMVGLAACVIGLAGRARADLIVSEPFNVGIGAYTAGMSITGNTTLISYGTGWGGNNWTTSASSSQTFGIQADSLSYPGVGSSGGSGNYVTQNLSGGSLSRTIPTSATSTTTTWTALLVNFSGLSATNNIARFQLTYDGGSAYFGFVGDGSGAATASLATTTSNFTNSAYETTSAYAANQTYLVVVEVIKNQSGTNEGLYLWMNPDPTVTPLTSAATLSVTNANIVSNGGTGVSTVFALGAGGQASNVTFDELRIGTTFGDVITAAVPEPSAMGLVLGLFPLLARRRGM